MIVKFWAISVSLIFAVSCIGEDKKIDCNASTYESQACAQAKYDSTDKKLNAVFKKMKSVMSKTQVKILVAGQKGWLLLRDNQCELETFADKGTGSNQRYTECRTALTELRIKQLESTPTDSIFE